MSTAKTGGVITFSPNITETVFALGQGGRVVGVTNFCDYPPEAKTREKLGGYLDPNLERITMLKPSLIILPGQLEKVAKLAEENKIPVLHANMDSLATIRDSVARIGAALNCTDKADELWNHIQEQIGEVKNAVKDLPRVKVLIINTRTDHNLDNLFTVGKTSFLSEMLDIAGGDNIFSDANENYFEASKESVVVRAPEVIIEFHAGEGINNEQQACFIADWNELSTVPAVKNHRVFLFLDSYGLRPGPRIALIAASLARLIHPDATVPAL